MVHQIAQFDYHEKLFDYILGEISTSLEHLDLNLSINGNAFVAGMRHVYDHVLLVRQTCFSKRKQTKEGLSIATGTV